MQRFSLSLIIAVGLATGILYVLPSGAAEKPDTKQIGKLVEQLGDGNFSEREKAMELLDQIGGPALEPLRKAVKDGDAEVQRRGQELIKKIEKRVEAEVILKPHMLSLKFKDTPINEAVDTINKKTGFAIQLHDPQKKLVDRKITWETSETTFWQAFDQFCEKAGLVEATPQDLANQNIANAKGSGGPPIPTAPPASGRVYRAGGMPMGNTGQLVLIDGKPKKETTVYAGAVRIRLLPPGTPIAGSAKQEGEIEVPLQVTPEPKVAWHGISRVRVDKALDDVNQELVQETNLADPNGDGFVYMANGGVMVKGGIAYGAYPRSVQGGLNQVGVRLKKGDKSTKNLKEIKGVVSVLAQSEPQALLTVEAVAKAAADDAFEFGDGGKLKVLKVSKGEEGQIDLQLELAVPPGIIPAGAPVARANYGQPRGGRAIVKDVMVMKPDASGSSSTAGFGGLNLLDAQGKPIPCISSSVITERQPDRTLRHVYSLSFKSAKDQADSAKLVFNGSRQVTIEVPFELKDIPVQ